MESEQERLIDEILWWSRTENDDARPDGDASGPWLPEIATVTSQVRRIWNAGDYDRPFPATWRSAPKASTGAWRRRPDLSSWMSLAAPVN